MALVCEFDPLEEGRPLYHAGKVVRESGRAFENGLEEVYVSALARGDSDVSALMRLFVEGGTYDEGCFPETSRVKRRLRETEEGRMAMGSMVEEIRAEGVLETLCRLVRDGLVSVQDAAASAGVDADDIRRALAAEG